MTSRMGDVSQRNPADPEHAVSRVFQRGPVVAADGGQRVDDESDEENGEQKMKDVSQRNPEDEEATANRVWERGGEKPVPEEAEE
ncbi:hypothetical protein [Halobacterium litoreum]|uniref:Uncharacterized protein n=1 Tax=Halobacterium litoreum TaxID=2039234 RepID=A0ABD5NDA2_9EURY|nr:hypothetical protein [Halobacterium litoreum]UHH13880.1 hypothetical protein LT972_02515 [Halobacterium litoreum]